MENFKMVPTIGLEPTTYALRVRCTTNCATSALKYCIIRKRICVKTFEFIRWFELKSVRYRIRIGQFAHSLLQINGIQIIYKSADFSLLALVIPDPWYTFINLQRSLTLMEAWFFARQVPVISVIPICFIITGKNALTAFVAYPCLYICHMVADFPGAVIKGNHLDITDKFLLSIKQDRPADLDCAYNRRWEIQSFEQLLRSFHTLHLEQSDDSLHLKIPDERFQSCFYQIKL